MVGLREKTGNRLVGIVVWMSTFLFQVYSVDALVTSVTPPIATRG